MTLNPHHIFTPSPSPLLADADLTVSQVLAWYEAQTLNTTSPRNAVKERRRIWKLFAQDVGTLPVTDCRPYHLLEWINFRFGDHAAWTRRRWNSTVQTPFNFAAKLGLIPLNPFRGLTFPQGNEGRDWTDEEYRDLMRCSPAYVRRLLVFIRFSGARPGEARSLEWAFVKRRAGAIIIDKHKTKHLTKLPRRIPLNSVLIKLLAYVRRHSSPAARFVFLNKIGLPWKDKVLNKHLAAVRLRAGLDNAVKLHGGRHTFATHAVMNGVDVATLAEILGHRSLATTNRYVHLAAKKPHLNAAMEQAVTGRNKHCDSTLSLGYTD